MAKAQVNPRWQAISRERRGNVTPVTDRPRRVLVVEDEESVRQLIRVNLTMEGFEVFTAVDGQDCLDQMPDVGPDLVTLDVMMPRLDGWETASRLRTSPESNGLRIVMLTARAQRSDRARAARLGVDAYLTKPFDPDELIATVRRLTGGN